MKRSSFERLQEAVNEHRSKLPSGSISLSDGQQFFHELRNYKEDGSIENTEKEAQAVPMVPFSNVLSSRLKDSSRGVLAEKAMHLAKTIMMGEKPRFWESWAHKSQHRSSVVKEYPEVDYVSKFLYRSTMQLTCALKHMGKEIKIPSPPAGQLISLNVRKRPSTLQQYFRNPSQTESVVQGLRYVWGTRGVEFRSKNLKDLNVRFLTADLDSEGPYVISMFERQLGQLFTSCMKPTYSKNGYEFYLVDFPTIMLALLHERFPLRFSLMLDNEALVEALIQTSRQVFPSRLGLLADNIQCLFVWSDNILKRRALYPSSYTCVHTPRMDMNQTSLAALEIARQGKGINKIDNKEFFDFARFFKDRTENIIQEDKIAQRLRLRRGVARG